MPFSVLDIVLITIDEWDNNLHGRTRLHKTVYLAQKKPKVKKVKFRPYYYGPYSDTLSSALTSVENLRLLDVRKEIIGPSPDGQKDIVEYVYSLDKDGNEYFEYLKKEYSSDYQYWSSLIKPIVAEFKEETTSKNMAMAAKIVFILTNDVDEPITVSEIKKRAKEYKWDIDNDVSMKSGLDHLRNLNLVKARKNKRPS